MRPSDLRQKRKSSTRNWRPAEAEAAEQAAGEEKMTKRRCRAETEAQAGATHPDQIAADPFKYCNKSITFVLGPPDAKHVEADRTGSVVNVAWRRRVSSPLDALASPESLDLTSDRQLSLNSRIGKIKDLDMIAWASKDSANRDFH